MLSLFLEEQIGLKDISKPVPSQNQSLVKVHMAGICKTDLELVKGYMNFRGVLGHEFVGTVVETSNTQYMEKRVCGEINFGCGSCGYCRQGLQRHCPERTVMGILNQNGAFAEYVVVPDENLCEVPDSVGNEQAVFVEPLAAAMEILEQVHIEPQFDVAVIGDGKLGLMICKVLTLTGCNLSLIGKHQRKIKLAQSFGVHAIHRDDISQADFDVIVEASGSPSGFTLAMNLIRPRGTLVLKSTYAGNLEFNAAPIVVDEITIVGSRCGQFKPAIRALERQLIHVDDLIDATYPFNEALTAFREAAKPGALKVLLNFDD